MRRGRLCFTILLAAIFFICIMSVLPGSAKEGIFVQSYRADLYLNGTLQENYVYRIEEADRYRMLYRP